MTRKAALKLHIGCGSTVVEGWENIDKSPGVELAKIPGLRPLLARLRILTQEQADATFPSGIVRADVRRGLKYPTASVGYIYSSHLIEHMSRSQGLELLTECARVLVPGGVIRIATPDLADVIQSYGGTGAGMTAADTFMQGLGTFVEASGSRAQRLARRLATAPHQWLYDAESLTRLLLEAGFEDVRARGYLESELPDIESLEIRRESLFVEARRP